MARQRFAWGLSVGSLLLLGCGSVQTSDGVWVERRREGTLESMQGTAAPAFQLTNWINSEGVTLDELRGRVILLDFWGVWCGPCRELTPQLTDLHDKYVGEGLVIIGVHTPYAAERMPAYVEEHGVPYIIGVDMSKDTFRAYRVDGFPDLYLIDRQGVIRFADVDPSVPGNLERAVVALLGESD